jgi:hypothetical protein
MSGTQVTTLHPPPKYGWQLRVELLEVTPKVWRRLLLPSTIRLPALHRVLQAAMGWTDSHLHEFVIAGQRYSTPDPDWADELKQRDERRIVLEKALGYQSRCFDYLYDFGDSWHHVVILEEHAPLKSDALVYCTDGANACPPEDVGGAHGYAEFLAGIADPQHDEHENLLTWVGGQQGVHCKRSWQGPPPPASNRPLIIARCPSDSRFAEHRVVTEGSRSNVRRKRGQLLSFVRRLGA